MSVSQEERQVRDLIDAFDVDQRGIHVERDQAKVGQRPRRREMLDGEAGGEFGEVHRCKIGRAHV